MWKDEVTLVQETTGYDDVGNEIATKAYLTIPCLKKSVARNEFYNAAIAGLKPELVLVIRSIEYSDEQKVVFNDKNLDIIRTYETGELLELVVGEKIGN